MEDFTLKYGYFEGFEYRIRKPLNSSVLGIGTNDVNFMVSNKGKIHPLYRVWYNMLYRCTDKYANIWPTYRGCSISDYFSLLSNFIKWSINNNYTIGYHLDKDILVRNNKIYSPELCMFVPAEINTCITNSNKIRGKYPQGVYKDGNLFKAQISTGGSTRKSLGRYSSMEEAHKAWQLAKLDHLRYLAGKYANINIDTLIIRLNNDILCNTITESI